MAGTSSNNMVNFSTIAFCSVFLLIALAQKILNMLSDCSHNSEAKVNSKLTSFTSKQRHLVLCQPKFIRLTISQCFSLYYSIYNKDRSQSQTFKEKNQVIGYHIISRGGSVGLLAQTSILLNSILPNLNLKLLLYIIWFVF